MLLSDTALAERASYAWWALTRACHHHPYDLAPTPPELADLLDAVGDLTTRLESISPTRSDNDLPGGP